MSPSRGAAKDETLAAVALRLRRGDLAGARAEGEAAMAGHPQDPRLLQLIGIACCRAGDLGAGAAFLQGAFERAPDLPRLRPDLANALVLIGEAAGALALCPRESDAELLRLRGYLLQQAGDHAGAAEAYGAVVAANPRDWEIWNNLGNARRETGNYGGAADALRRAIALRPGLPALHMNLGASLAGAGAQDAALTAYAEATRLDPANPAASLERGRLLRLLGRLDEAAAQLNLAHALAPQDAEISLELARLRWVLRDEAGAVAAYRSAVALVPSRTLPWLELGIVLERSNRLGELPALLDEATTARADGPELGYLHALVLRREGRLEEALAAARAAPGDVEPARRAELIGKLADAIGHSGEAFEAFRQMNRIAAETPAARRSDPAGYVARLDAMISTASPQWFGRWGEAAAPEGARPSPAFLVGFPRSGTTLLDTFLMGHPETHVLEEEPMLQHARDALDAFARLPELTEDETDRLRGLYFETLDAVAPEAAGKRIIDKLPLNLLGAPLIHRLFPDAAIILALRHPCDAVLSCFMQAFEPNDAMANFLDLGDAARLYDRAFTFWEQCRASLPLRVHPLRYESLIAEPEAEMRALVEFLGLGWDARLLDHRRTAAARGTIVTPSYEQVTQPLYSAAAGRWERYRNEMAAVLPILSPWAERLGYAVS